MRLLQINRYYADVGGTERYLADVSSLLEARGVAISILYGLPLKEALHVPGREEIALPALFDPATSEREKRRMLEEQLRRIAPDVIQLHHVGDPNLIRTCAARLPTVQFVHVHSSFLCPGDGRFAKWPQEICRRKIGPFCLIAPFLQFCGTRHPGRLLANYRLTKGLLEASRSVVRILVASGYMRDLFVEHGFPETRILVNPYPFVGDHRRMDTITERAGSILYVGRLSPQKGVESLIRAVATLEERCHLTLVGDGPSRARIEELARKKLGGRHEMMFTGWLPYEGVRALYRQSQVVAFPSVWPEPFGLVGLEASGHGKPIVAFDVGGVREWLVDGQNGFLVPPKDIEAFAAALRRLLLDEELRRRMGQNGVELALTRFNPKRHVDAMMRLYEQVLGAASGRGVARAGTGAC